MQKKKSIMMINNNDNENLFQHLSAMNNYHNNLAKSSSIGSFSDPTTTTFDLIKLTTSTIMNGLISDINNNNNDNNNINKTENTINNYSNHNNNSNNNNNNNNLIFDMTTIATTTATSTNNQLINHKNNIIKNTTLGLWDEIGLTTFFPDITTDSVFSSTTVSVPQSGVATTPYWLSAGRIQIPLYAVIFLLAVIGNSLVIMTLVQNKRMRTITNVFLLNLAVSDLLLGVLCMPFTLVGALLRDFVFGELMCKFLPYLQASSVAVSAWTLVAIGVERYYAICHPLRSRRWQTLSHAYKLIAIIWSGSLLFMSPIAFLSRLIPTNQGHRKCREHWPNESGEYERAFNIFLDVILLVLPLLFQGATYSLITRTLWQGMRTERALKNHIAFNTTTQSTNNLVEVYINAQGTPCTRCPSTCHHQSTTTQTDTMSWQQLRSHWSQESTRKANSMRKHCPGLRRSNAEKSLLNKKRVIKMLFVVVLEFFICWTPLYVINTIALFSPQLVYQYLGYTAISYFQLLAYSSSCCNPITYCFMNCGFRKAFLNLFRCFKRFREPRRISMGGVAGGLLGAIGGGGGAGRGGTDLNNSQQASDAETTRLQSQRLCTDSP